MSDHDLTSRDRRRGGCRGFTLIELVLVLGIVLILGAVAAPRYAAADARYRVACAAQRVAADLRLAQRSARSRGQAATVSFDVNDDSYQVSGVPALDGSGTYTVSLGSDPYRCSLTTATFGAGATGIVVVIGGVEATATFGAGAAVSFDGWGVPDANGTVVVTAGAETRTVTLSCPSGQVSLP